MVVKIKNNLTGEIVTVGNVRDIQSYTHNIKGDVLVLTDSNFGSDTHVMLSEYHLFSVE